MVLLVVLLVAVLASITNAEDDLVPTSGMTITKSARVKPGTHRVTDLRVKGDDLVLDFTGVVLDGSREGATADSFTGTGLHAEGCKRLTIKNLTVRGYKLGMRLVSCDELTLEGCDVSGNYRQHLKSTPRAEDLADWLSAHENDDGQWLRYGAGIYVERSRKVTVVKCRARRGQNGLCLVRVDDSAVLDNDFSFLSGWGLAMWRSSRNDVSNNKLDWCMRGYSHGVYSRGQDSAGILVYEQCHENVFAYNSATHGGDGFFLYAGNETLERTGTGGCNGNIVFRNDFSHAAANGIECTFSKGNVFVENRLDECDHGVWAGYSYETTIARNTIRDCNHGVSIEHGHDNRIDGNTFERCGVAINLWGPPNAEFAKKPFGKKNDTSSRGYRIVRNVRKDVKQPDRVDDTKDVIEDGAKVPPLALELPKTRGTQDTQLPETALRGRKWIFVDDWGPYDFESLRVFPETLDAWNTGEVWALGPGGAFSVAEVTSGFAVEPPRGTLPAKLTVSAEKAGPFRFVVRSGGEERVARGFLLRAEWDVKHFAWEGQGAKKPPKDWEKLIASKPALAKKAERLDFNWGAGGPEGLAADHFATLASARIDLPAGRYEVRTVSDDGVRVLVDGQKLIDDWTWHGPTEHKKEIDLAAGEHSFRVEHFEIDGWAVLQLGIRPVKLETAERR